MALAGSMAGGIAGFLGNPAELVMVRMQADKAKPVESESTGQARPIGCQSISHLVLSQIPYTTTTLALSDFVPSYHIISLSAQPWLPSSLGWARLMIDRLNYRNSISGLARMTREEGITSWARGIGPNTARAILMNMSQLAR